MTIVEPARAKLNLALHVRARRSDGYHELETLFAFVRHGDRIEAETAATDGFAIGGPFGDGLETNDGNLVVGARDLFRARIADPGPVALRLDKRLPVASGIGGGSADAAATLRVLARIADIAPDDPRMFACAAELGSDVPACLLGRTAIGTGRGEMLVPVEGLAGTPVLMVNPGVPVSTARVFSGWDRIDRGPLPGGPLFPRLIAARNDLEPAARAAAPAIDTVLAILGSGHGVLLARMSGSGATCFALYADAAARAAAAAEVRASHPAWWCVETELM